MPLNILVAAGVCVCVCLHDSVNDEMFLILNMLLVNWRLASQIAII